MARLVAVEDAPSSGARLIPVDANGTPQDAPQSRSWADVPGEALSNLPKSAGNFVSGIYQAVRHPIDTGASLLDAAAGGLRNAVPETVRNFVDGKNPNPASLRASNTADAIGSFYKDRYGSMDGFKNALATDPVGVASDASTVLTGAGALAGKIPALSKPITAAGATFNSPAQAFTRAANATNPLSVVSPIVKTVGAAVGAVGKNVLGLTTMQGPENIAQAAKAGMRGDTQFIDNLNQKVPYNNVIDDALAGVKKMKQEASIGYQQGMAGAKADKTLLDFSSIDSELGKQINSLKVTSTTTGRSKFVVGNDQMKTIQELNNVVDQWRIDKGLHTPEGLDALKRRIDAIPSEYGTAAEKAKSAMYNAVKDTIVKQVPEYADTMKSYEAAKNLESEITKTLSLTKNATEDTALRKLQQVARNNANTNFGHRLNLLKTLEDKGGVNLQSALAGQSMSPWMSRGLVGQGGMLGTTIGAATSGSLAPMALLPLMSPKAVGGALYGGGRAAGFTADNLGKIGITPARAKRLGLLLSKSGELDKLGLLNQ